MDPSALGKVLTFYALVCVGAGALVGSFLSWVFG